VEEFTVDTKGGHDFRKRPIRMFKLKDHDWNPERRDLVAQQKYE
jgi:hypothetical protein